jgi:hypothetical protein
VIKIEIKAKITEPPQTNHRPNNNVITINTLNNGNSIIISIILLHVNSQTANLVVRNKGLNTARAER